MTNELFFVITAAVIVMLISAVFIISFIMVYQKRKFRVQQELVYMKESYNQELLRTQLEIQEQTLKTISQEIHDNIGQGLSLAKLNLATMDPNQPDKLQQKIEDSRHLVGKAIQDLRDLSKSLNTDSIAAMGLIKAVEYELDMIGKTGACSAQLEVKGNVTKLEPQKELILFRIIQEALNNIIKHSGCRAITVKADYDNENILLMVADDGQGFDLTLLNEAKTGFGLGIRNMHNRATLIGAEFSVNSARGQGTTVKIAIPIKNTNA